MKRLYSHHSNRSIRTAAAASPSVALLHCRHQARRRQAIGRACCEPLEGRRLLSFSPAASFPVGTNPQAVATADFNNDGKPDLATANFGAGTVSVLLGNGAGGGGSFQPAQNSVAGGGPDTLAAGDFNADGKLDLVTTNSSRTMMLLGNGDGTFAAPVELLSIPESSWQSIATGDLNADGKLDLVVAYNVSEPDVYTIGYVSVLLGQGDGSFAATTTYDTYYGATSSPVLGDVNGDGKLDVAVAGWSMHAAIVFLGNGDGTLQVPRAFSTGAGWGANSLAAGDFNADGKLDLVTTNYMSNSASVFLGNGDGTFQTARSFAAGNVPASATAGDVNGDGKLDLVVTNPFVGAVSVLLGNGDGSLARPITTTTGGSSISSLVMADFNGDGRPDAAVANGGSNDVSVLLNDGVWGTVTPVRPAVTDVFLAGTAWTSAFRNSLPTRGEGEAAFGHRLGPTPQSQTIGYSNLNRISLRFDKPASVDASDLVVTGVNVSSYRVTSFAYDAASFTATWTLNRKVPNDKLTFALDLDGAPGADYTSSVRVLPGDLDRNGAVNVFDFNALKSNLNKTGIGVLGGDINGDDVVNVFDFNDLKSYLGKTTPA